MGEGELDPISRVVGRLEAGIDTLTAVTNKIGEANTEIVTALNSLGERVDKLEPRVDALHDHHTGRTAVARFLKALPWGVIGGAAGTVAANVPWKSIAGLVH